MSWVRFARRRCRANPTGRMGSIVGRQADAHAVTFCHSFHCGIPVGFVRVPAWPWDGLVAEASPFAIVTDGPTSMVRHFGEGDGWTVCFRLRACRQRRPDRDALRETPFKGAVAFGAVHTSGEEMLAVSRHLVGPLARGIRGLPVHFPLLSARKRKRIVPSMRDDHVGTDLLGHC